MTNHWDVGSELVSVSLGCFYFCLCCCFLEQGSRLGCVCWYHDHRWLDYLCVSGWLVPCYNTYLQRCSDLKVADYFPGLGGMNCLWDVFGRFGLHPGEQGRPVGMGRLEWVCGQCGRDLETQVPAFARLMRKSWADGSVGSLGFWLSLVAHCLFCGLLYHMVRCFSLVSVNMLCYELAFIFSLIVAHTVISVTLFCVWCEVLVKISCNGVLGTWENGWFT